MDSSFHLRTQLISSSTFSETFWGMPWFLQPYIIATRSFSKNKTKQNKCLPTLYIPENLGVVSYNSSYEDSEDSTVNTGLEQPDIMTSWEV